MLNKYAVMMYESDDNGKTFYEFKCAMFCASCHEKVVTCPHHTLDEEHVITLGHGVTHVKLVSPRVRFRHDEKEGTTEETEVQNSEVDIVEDGESERASRPTSAAEIYSARTVERLWEDYSQRYDLKRNNPRQLSANRTLTLINQFVEVLLRLDLNSANDDKCLSVLNRLYLFFEHRYVKPNTAHLSIHDFFSSLVEHQNSEKLVWLFLQVLIGNLDASVIRYVLLVKDLSQRVKWKDVEDFRLFSKIIYSFLEEDDIETLFLGFVSFGENTISSDAVVNYVSYLIMKYREPRFMAMESILVSCPTQEPAYMTEGEFSDSAEQIITVYDRLQRHLFHEAVACVTQMDGIQENLVPILRLAQISSYVNLVSSTYDIKRQIKSWQINGKNTSS